MSTCDTLNAYGDGMRKSFHVVHEEMEYRRRRGRLVTGVLALLGGGFWLAVTIASLW